MFEDNSVNNKESANGKDTVMTEVSTLGKQPFSNGVPTVVEEVAKQLADSALRRTSNISTSGSSNLLPRTPPWSISISDEILALETKLETKRQDIRMFGAKEAVIEERLDRLALELFNLDEENPEEREKFRVCNETISVVKVKWQLLFDIRVKKEADYKAGLLQFDELRARVSSSTSSKGVFTVPGGEHLPKIEWLGCPEEVLMTNKPAATSPTDALNHFENRLLTLCTSPDVDKWRRGKKLEGPEVTWTTFKEIFLETYDVKLVDKFTRALTELCCIRMLPVECLRVFRARFDRDRVRPLLAGASEEDRSSLDYIYGLSVRVTQCGADDPLLDDRVSLKNIIPNNVLQYFEEHHNCFTLEVKYAKNKCRYVAMGSSKDQLGNNKRRDVNPSSAASIDVNKKRRYNGPVSHGGSTTSGNNQNVRQFSGSRGNQGVRRLGPTSSMNTNHNEQPAQLSPAQQVRSARNLALEANKNARKSRRREARAAKKAEGFTFAGVAAIGSVVAPSLPPVLSEDVVDVVDFVDVLDIVASSPPPVISEDVVNAENVADAVDEDTVMKEAPSGLEGENQESPLLEDSEFDEFMYTDAHVGCTPTSNLGNSHAAAESGVTEALRDNMIPIHAGPCKCSNNMYPELNDFCETNSSIVNAINAVYNMGSSKSQKAAEDLYQKTNSLICFVPVTLGGHKIMALVDSGATTSIVSPSFLLKNKISFLPDKKIYKLAARGTTVTGLGITSPLTLVHNEITITHSFDVFELSYDHINVFIGSDLMNKVGIYLSGLATSWSGTNIPTNPDPILNEIDQPNNSPFGTKAEHESFMAAIQPLLKANARIPITSLCTVPEYVIRLDTPPGKIAYRSQYPIPVILLPVLREQVKSWLRDEVIEVAPVNTVWNSPITFAPKKGADGVTFSEKRPCLYTRHLNLLLEDCRYPFPNIQKIFQKMSGAKVFTTLDLKAAFHRFKVFEEHK
ncbi:hypothetical protein INT47_011526 [Mucor saturninus]|uniref:Aspartic peptidase DDI1-type domain-containing protein n=1 Tax=Mucor saturninus TaxID=64648 RepID=A0A8H7UV86_9FUNG|nr:hypothetical protein INT47_011526 [Mucor saturninus]